MKLGFFENFKFGDAVLLSGASQDIQLLVARLVIFVQSQEPELALHSVASVASRHPAQLFASHSSVGTGFRWLCSADELPTIQDKLEALISSGTGHQYFELADTSTTLVVSIGEYDDAWWQHHG